MRVRAINPPSLHQPPGDYSHAVQVGNLVFVAGQIPMDKQGRIPMRDFRAQTEQVFQNLKGVSGSTILGSGEVALILDVPGLIQKAAAREATSGGFVRSV